MKYIFICCWHPNQNDSLFDISKMPCVTKFPASFSDDAMTLLSTRMGYSASGKLITTVCGRDNTL